MKEQAESLLQDQINLHKTKKCNCTEKTPCYAGQYLQGIISDKQVVEDISYEQLQKNIKLQKALEAWAEILQFEKALYLKETLSKKSN